jgi:hypothetical protein
MVVRTSRESIGGLALLLCALLCCDAVGAPTTTAGGDEQRQSTGPDIICSHIYGFLNWGPEKGVVAVAVGTRSCNAGSMPVSWRIGSQAFPDSRHPVIAQNMYRYMLGRFEQVGQSWLKHGFCAVDGDDFCTGCQDTDDCAILGVGCSDPYAAVLNGWQTDLGPKFQVNPINGGFPYPPVDPMWTGVVARRLQVLQSDLPHEFTPPSTRYFVEAHYLAADDALWGNDLNNMAYREVAMNQQGIVKYVGDTFAEQPALFAWREIDPGVVIETVDVPADGRYFLAYRVTLRQGGTFVYEYALLNYNSDRSGHAFVVPAPVGVELTEIGFHDARYHSGEPYDNTDWQSERGSDQIRWYGAPHAQDVNANALRWGTTYNFRFASNRPPRSDFVQLELFKPHATPIVDIAALAPTPWEDVNLDGLVDGSDVSAVLQRWATTHVATDVNRDGIVNIFDLLAVLSAWGS